MPREPSRREVADARVRILILCPGGAADGDVVSLRPGYGVRWAVVGGSGWAEIEPVFHRMGASFCECRAYDIEVIAVRACDELAYTIAHERGSGPFAAR